MFSSLLPTHHTPTTAITVMPIKDRELREVRMEIAGLQRELSAARAAMQALEVTNSQLQQQASADGLRSPYFRYLMDIGGPLGDPLGAWQTPIGPTPPPADAAGEEEVGMQQQQEEEEHGVEGVADDIMQGIYVCGGVVGCCWCGCIVV